MITAAEGTTPRRQAAPLCPALRPTTTRLLLRGYAPSGRYCSKKGSVGPSKCACGRGPPGHKVRGRRHAARGRQNRAPKGRSGLFRATLRRSIGQPAPVNWVPSLKLWGALLPLLFKLRLVRRAALHET